MIVQPRNADLSPKGLLVRQNKAIEALTGTVGLLQQQAQALQRRIDSIGGIPLPDGTPEPG
jgi:hypothetical protein